MNSTLARGTAAHARRPSDLLLVALAAALSSPPLAAGQRAAERIDMLEAEVRALAERVTTLEAAGTTDSGAGSGTDGIAWQLGDGLRGQPLRISHRAMDIDKGRIELLLEITEPLPAPARWQTGRPAPIVLTLRAPDGTEHSMPMTLLRGAKLEPGGQLHLIAELEPALAAAATQVSVEQSD
jgi:hypothetical protein